MSENSNIHVGVDEYSIRTVGDHLANELDGAIIHANGDVGGLWMRVKVIKPGDTPHSTANLFYLNCSQYGEVYWRADNAGLDSEGDRRYNMQAFRRTPEYTIPLRRAIRAFLLKMWRKELDRSLNLDQI